MGSNPTDGTNKYGEGVWYTFGSHKAELRGSLPLFTTSRTIMADEIKRDLIEILNLWDAPLHDSHDL